MLQSKLLSRSERLLDCEVKDAAHVKFGDTGDFVSLIQEVLFRIGRPRIADEEANASLYGKTAAAAVLQYKTKRNIINRSYQSQPDDVVSKMTVRSLDDEMQRIEA